MDIINIITSECQRFSNILNNFYSLKNKITELIKVKHINIEHMSKSIHYNKGELGEIFVVQKLYNLPKEQLIDIFG